MSLEKIDSNKESLDFVKLADELYKLQLLENDGRGIGCVQGIITFLRMGNIEAAQQAAKTDHDKIRNYPDVENFLKEELNFDL